MRSPIRWVGGKSRLRQQIVALLPKHRCYVEPFCGAAWVLFAKPPSLVEVLNDIDGDLVNFFRVIRDSRDEFLQSFDWQLVSRAEFDHLRSVAGETLDPVQRAHRFFYLIMAGWGGELGSPRFQVSRKDSGHGNRLIGALETLDDRIRPAHTRLRTVIIEGLDWRDCLTRYDGPDTVFYIDPPYLGNGCNYAHNMRGAADHGALAERLRVCQGRWLLSGYDTPEMRELYDGCTIRRVTFASGMATEKSNEKRTVNEEVLISNYLTREEEADVERFCSNDTCTV